MEKIIIENRTELDLSICLEIIKAVIKLGRISNNNTQYCYYTTFELNGKNFSISTDLNKKSDRFIIC